MTSVLEVAHLQAIGVLAREADDPSCYRLTEAGADLARVLAVLGDWGMRWLPVDRPLLEPVEPVMHALTELGFGGRRRS